MLHRQSISTLDDPRFPFCWELYLAAFPEDERRSLDYHTETMGREQFHCDVVLRDDEPIGILFWWELRDFVFVEHLAISPTVRGTGYGNQVFSEFVGASEKPILLEVEHPEDEVSRRRIGFYERMGFVLNAHQYRQPSFKQIAGEGVDLAVMTYPTPISESELQHFVECEFPVVHFRNFR